jgi:hypothetical protein
VARAGALVCGDGPPASELTKIIRPFSRTAVICAPAAEGSTSRTHAASKKLVVSQDDRSRDACPGNRGQAASRTNGGRGLEPAQYGMVSSGSFCRADTFGPRQSLSGGALPCTVETDLPNPNLGGASLQSERIIARWIRGSNYGRGMESEEQTGRKPVIQGV